MKTLYAHRTKRVLFLESSKTPDLVAQKVRKKFLTLKTSKPKHVILICLYHFKHARLPQTEELLVFFSLNGPKFQIDNICVQKNDQIILDTLQTFQHFKQFQDVFKTHEANSQNKFVFTPQNLFQLMPAFIPKPWGQEIWYSGIETRGVAGVKTFERELAPAVKPREPRGPCSRGKVSFRPLSWIVGAVPHLIFGNKFAGKDPILIKILDPNPNEIIGDLYYELHLEKNEVYIVTDITSRQGKIKIGINPQKLKEYHNNLTQYKNDFFKSVLDYENIRKQIDRMGDEKKEIPHTLAEQEITLRNYMDSFCGFVDLNPGDVIHVPTRVPHALQHGVKVIEFQTPTYERLIISFAQKVLTQPHWDTKRAFDLMHLDVFQKQKPQILSKSKHLLKELVCSFPDFQISRWTLDANTNCEIQSKSFYRILFMVSGTSIPKIPSLKKSSKQYPALLANMCLLIPKNVNMILSAKDKSTFLIGVPK